MTKEQLRKYGAIRRERAQIERMIAELEAVTVAPGAPRIDGMPRNPSPGTDAIANLVARRDELRRRYSAKLEELTEAQLAIEAAIDSLETTERTLMRCHYIEGLTWEEVSVRIGYSWRQTHRIHARALIKIAEK